MNELTERLEVMGNHPQQAIGIICIAGTEHALRKVRDLIDELLSDPSENEIRAVNPKREIELIVRRLHGTTPA